MHTLEVQQLFGNWLHDHDLLTFGKLFGKSAPAELPAATTIIRRSNELPHGSQSWQ